VTRSRYVLLARVASESEPDVVREVKTDGEVLSCGCPRWRFNQERDADGHRTCKHTRGVEPHVRAVGGLRAAMALVQAGGTQLLTDRAAQASREPCDLECGNRFFTGQPRCRHRRNIHQSMASLGRPIAGAPPEEQAPSALPDWLGGGRAILIRE
jgi:hypothetical protein